MVAEKRRCGEDEPGRAEPALGRPVLHEGALKSGEHAGGGHPLDRRDATALGGERERETAQRRSAVHEDGAAAAGPEVAAALRAGEVEVLPEKVEEDPLRGDDALDGSTVELRPKEGRSSH